MDNTVTRAVEILRHGWDVIESTLALDVFDTNYAYSSEELGVLSMPADRLPRPGVLLGVVVFFYQLWLSLAPLFLKGSEAQPPEGCAVFFFATSNQRLSLAPVVKNFSQGRLVRVGLDRSAGEQGAYQFPVALFFLASLPFLPLITYRLLRSSGYRRRSFSYALNSYWVSYGCFLVARVWLHHKCIRAVTVANDHDAVIRAIVRAAIQEDIPTFYIQHASVTSNFPPLCFDYALLEGMEALNSYERAGSSQTQVFLVGMPKIDAHLHEARSQATAGSIGVGTNLRDPVARVDELCGRIRLELPELPMVLRPHPGDGMPKTWKNMAQKYGMELSESNVESSLRFLERIDVLVAGDSSLHLEAVLMNVYAIYYDFDGTHRDYYGYERNHVVEYLPDPTRVCHRLRDLARSKPPVQMRAKPYCATLGTPHHGRSSALAASIIDEVVSNRRLHLQQWKRIQGVELQAYEPSPSNGT